MTKEVMISIRGIQFDAANPDSDPVEVIVSGEYYFKNGSHYLIYDEAVEESSQPNKSRIKFSENYMELTKKGQTSTHMIFETGKKNVTYYYTPYGSILIGVDGKTVDFTEEENHMVVDVAYGLEVNNEHLADCTIHLEVKPKGSRVSI